MSWRPLSTTAGLPHRKCSRKISSSVGLTIVRAGKLDLAVEVWEKAFKGGADLPELLDHLGRLSFRLQHLDQSAAAARRLATQPGWEARGFLLLGQVEACSKTPAARSKRFRKGLEFDPDAKASPWT